MTGGADPATERRKLCLGGEHGGDLVGKVGVNWRAGREVDRDRQLPALRVPHRGLVQGDLEHDPGHGVHQTRFFDQVQESVGVEQTPGGVVPAPQCLHVVDVAGGQVDLGPVVDDGLVVGQRLAQFIDRLQPGGEARVVGTAVDVVAVAGTLGLVHGYVGFAQQGVQVKSAP